MPKVEEVPKVDCVGASTPVSIHTRVSYRVPSVIGGRTITPTGNYFDDANWHSHQDITARKIVCPKSKCGAQGSRDYDQHHLAATAAIPEPFGASQHFCTKNSDGKLSYEYKDIQSKYVCIKPFSQPRDAAQREGVLESG